MASDERNAGNIVNGFFRIKLRALAADLVEDVDEMRLDVEQAEFEYRKEADGAGPDDDHIGLDRLTHGNSIRSQAGPRLNGRIID